MNEINNIVEMHERSLADAITLIENDSGIGQAKRAQWLCSIRRFAVWTERNLENLPARLTALRQPISRLNAARLNITQKTLSNHKSNIRAALNHLSDQGLTLARGIPLSPDWCSIMAQISDPWARQRLYSLCRYLSARAIQPDDMNDSILIEYFAHRKETTFHKVTASARRETARAWNSCIDNVSGFPTRHLSVESLKSLTSGPEWDAFPKTFREEIEAYLERLKFPHRSANGRRRPGCQPSTIKTRRREILAAAKVAVECGMPITTFNCLRDLLVPNTAGAILDAYWARDGDRPKNYVIDLAWKFVSIARDTNSLDEAELEKLDEMRYSLEQHRKNGLTDKNLAVVRAVLSTNIWTKVIMLPDRLMSDAERTLKKSPVKAAVLAELAIAIRILTFAPVRVGNLAKILLDINLIRPGGTNTPYWLVFPGYDVKNGTDLTFPFDINVSNFIHQFVRDFRPILLRGVNKPNLFPGGKGNGRCKLASTLSDQITKRIEKELGLRITAHQFRHAAAAIILKNQPGNYELVRRILGHRTIKTTANFYIGLETMESSQQFGQMILDQTSNNQKELLSNGAFSTNF